MEKHYAVYYYKTNEILGVEKGEFEYYHYRQSMQYIEISKEEYELYLNRSLINPWPYQEILERPKFFLKEVYVLEPVRNP